MNRIERLNKILNSQSDNLDYHYDVKTYKEYLKEWLKHKDEKEYLDGGVLSFAEFWEHDIDYEFEDYNKILKLIDEHNKKKELVTNGGPGSGNHNPGQGRGVGKPSNKTGKSVKSSSPSLKMSENSKKFYEKLNPKIQESFEKCLSRLKKTNISLDNVELEFINSNTSGGDNGWVNVVDGDNINSRMIVNLIKPVLKKFTKKEQDVFKHSFVADNSSEAIIDHEFGHVLMYKKAAEIGIKPKSAHLFAEMIVKNEAKKLNIDLNDESTENFSEYAHRNYTEFIAEAYSRPDYSKLTQNVSDSLCNNKYSKDDFKNFIIEMTGIQNSLNIIDYLRNNLSAKSYFRSQRLCSILNKVNRGNPYHDEKGRFASKNGGYYKSSFVTKGGKEIDEYCSNFKELSKVLIKNGVKSTKEKVLGKELLGRRIDILNSDSIMNTVNRNAEDKKRVEEIKYQIETKKKSGIIPIIIRDNNSIDIVDGTHTLEAFMRLKEEGKKYYIPILITTPELVEKWENKFESIEDLQKSQKSLIKVREYEE